MQPNLPCDVCSGGKKNKKKKGGEKKEKKKNKESSGSLRITILLGSRTL